MEESIRLETKLKLLPLQVIFSTFINLPAHSLIEFLKKEAEENPFLKFDFDERKIEEIAQEVSINEELIQQLHLLNVPECFIKIGEFIIMNLEENGYFKMKLDEVAKILNVTTEEVEKSLKIVQLLDPPGIGARNLQECLLIQVKRYFNDSLLTEIIEKYWDLLTKRKFKEISEKMKIDENKLEEIIERLKKLNPYPLNKKKVLIKRIIPEGKIEKDGDKLKVYIEDKLSPFIKIETDYEKYLTSSFISKKEKFFLENKLKRVKLIIKMLEKRRKFLEETFDEIVTYQKEFFENGNLLPLREKDIAERKKVSISTISRAVNGKYLNSPIGIIKVKDLFVPEFKYSISKTFIMMKIKELIEKERKPLSDREISVKLGYMGIKISPRTINKYRNQMGILNSYLR